MKKTKLKTLLLAVLMCVGGGINVWGETITIRPTYKGTNVTGQTNETAPCLVDGSGISTKWCGTFQDPTWITVQANNTILTGYELYNGNDTQSYSSRRWKSWKVEGSNDYSTWTTIHTVTDANMSTTNYGQNTYTITNNTTKYTYYRFCVTAIEGGTGLFQMSDLKLTVIPAETTGWNLIGFNSGSYTRSDDNNVSFAGLANPTYAAWGNSTASNIHESGDQGIFFGGTCSASTVDVSIAIYHYTLSIPSYTKLVRTANYKLTTASNRHHHGGGVYLFNDYSTASSTALDATYNQIRNEGKSYKVAKCFDQNATGTHTSLGSGTGSMTFDNSTGSSAQLISKYMDLLHSCGCGCSGSGKTGTEWIAWMESSQNNEWHYYKYVTFDANGGTGSISQLTIDNSGSLTTNTITRTGYTFAGWNTQADGSGTAYADGGAITATSDSKGPVTLYAVWSKKSNIDSEGAVKYEQGHTVTPADVTKDIEASSSSTKTAFDLSEATVTKEDAATIVTNIRHSENAANAFIFLPKVDNLDPTTKAKKNVITTDGTTSTCQNLELVDGTPMVTALVGKEFTATNASYKRNVSNNWGTICLPYAVKSDATIQYYKLRDTQGTTGTLYFEKVDEVPANTPAAFYQTNPGEIAPTATNAAIAIQSNENNTGVSYYLVGTYKGLTLQKSQNDCFYIAQNQFWCADQSENGVTINPFRAYITTTNPNTSTAKASSLSISIWDGNEATAIGTIDANGDVDVNTRGKYVQDGRVVIVKNGKKYNTAGQQVK